MIEDVEVGAVRDHPQLGDGRPGENAGGEHCGGAALLLVAHDLAAQDAVAEPVPLHGEYRPLECGFHLREETEIAEPPPLAVAGGGVHEKGRIGREAAQCVEELRIGHFAEQMKFQLEARQPTRFRFELLPVRYTGRSAVDHHMDLPAVRIEVLDEAQRLPDRPLLDDADDRGIRVLGARFSRVVHTQEDDRNAPEEALLIVKREIECVVVGDHDEIVSRQVGQLERKRGVEARLHRSHGKPLRIHVLDVERHVVAFVARLLQTRDEPMYLRKERGKAGVVRADEQYSRPARLVCPRGARRT